MRRPPSGYACVDYRCLARAQVMRLIAAAFQASDRSSGCARGSTRCYGGGGVPPRDGVRCVHDQVRVGVSVAFS